MIMATNFTELERRLARVEDKHLPCPGPEMRKDLAVVQQQVAGLKDWEKAQNGTLRDLRDELRVAREERQRQIEMIRTEIAVSHTQMLEAMAQRERSAMALTLSGMGVIAAVVGVVIKLVGS